MDGEQSSLKIEQQDNASLVKQRRRDSENSFEFLKAQLKKGNRAKKALREILGALAHDIQFSESLILAQDERWRRA